MPYGLIQLDTCTTAKLPSKYLYNQNPICQRKSVKEEARGEIWDNLWDFSFCLPAVLL